MSSQNRRLFILLIVLVVLSAAYALLSIQKRRIESPSTKDFSGRVQTSLRPFKGLAVHRIDFFTNDKLRYSLVPTAAPEKLGWELAAASGIELDAKEIRALAASVEYMELNSLEVEQGKNRAYFGLDKPPIRIDLYVENELVTIFRGFTNPTNESFYLLLEDEIYLVNSATGKLWEKSIDDLRIRLLAQLDLEAGGLSQLHMEAPQQPTISIRIASSEESKGLQVFSPYLLVKPYSKPIRVDSYQLDELVKKIPNPLRVRAFIDDNPRDLSQYGLSPEQQKRIRIFDRESSGFDLLLGSEASPRTIFARRSNSSAVFTVDSAILQLLDVDPFKLMDKFVFLYNIDELESVELQVRDAKYTYLLEHGASPQAGARKPIRASLNTRELDDSSSRKYYQDLLSIFYEGAINGSKFYTPDEVSARISYQFLDGTSHQAGFYDYALEDYYAVSIDGQEPQFLVGAYQLEKLRELSELLVKTGKTDVFN